MIKFSLVMQLGYLKRKFISLFDDIFITTPVITFLRQSTKIVLKIEYF